MKLSRSAIYFLLPSAGIALIAGCAHTQEAPRGPASITEPRVSSETKINRDGKIGGYTIDFEGDYPIDATRTFATVVDAFRGVNLQTLIGNELAPLKKKPLNKLRTSIRFAKAKDPTHKDLAYVFNGYPDGHPSWGDESKIDCSDTLTKESGKGHWIQDCVPDFTYKETRKYMSAFDQFSECTEIGQEAKCRLIVSGVMEPVHMPWLKKVVLSMLFGATDYSATQAAHLAVDSQLDTFYAISELLKTDPPYVTKTADGYDLGPNKKAIADYTHSEMFAELERVKKKYPDSIDDTSSVVLVGPH